MKARPARPWHTSPGEISNQIVRTASAITFDKLTGQVAANGSTIWGRAAFLHGESGLAAQRPLVRAKRHDSCSIAPANAKEIWS